MGRWIVSINKKRAAVFSLASLVSVVITCVTYADALQNARACLYSATQSASQTIASVPEILSLNASSSEISGGQATLGNWDETTLSTEVGSGAIGYYHRIWGWSAADTHFYEIAYFGRGCGMLSYSKMVCKAYVEDSIFSQSSNLAQYTRQGWSFRCSLCRGKALSNVGSGITEQSVNESQLAYSVLQTDKETLKQQSAGSRSVILTGLVDDEAKCSLSYQEIERD